VHPVFVFFSPHYCSRCAVHGGTVHGTVHFIFFILKKRNKKRRNRKKTEKKETKKEEEKENRNRKKNKRKTEKKNNSYSVDTWCLLKVLKESCLHILFSLYIVLLVVF